MGKNWKRNRKRKHRVKGNDDGEDGKKKPDPSKYGQERDPYRLVAGGNYKMEAYYAYQGLHDFYLDKESGTFRKCETAEEKEEERQRWIQSLKTILPASFRIGNDVDPALRMQLEKELDESVGKEMDIIVMPKGLERQENPDTQPETKTIAPAKKLGFIPHAYQLCLDRQTIRRNPRLESFHEWLKVQSHAGFITRQETVSMLPPVILDVEPHHIVMDMCAAPGSKTSQLLEIVNLPSKEHDLEPTGCVVANDSDSKRAYMLVHQIKRINSPAIFITSCDAQFFPLIRDEAHPTEGIFDRVLADVPCTGDGTTRKNPGIWKRWGNINALGLHPLQLAIALKGARLTKVGGYICYSTCAMNPIENEAVVAEILRASEGSLELVDRRAEMNGFFARPGLSTWHVLSEPSSRRKDKNVEKKNNAKMQARRKAWAEKQNQQEESADAKMEAKGEDDGEVEKETAGVVAEAPEVSTEADTLENKDKAGGLGTGDKKPLFNPGSFYEAELRKLLLDTGLKEYASFDDVPEESRKRVRRSCFPPTPEEAARFKLERCMRCLPQDMDTGAFFVALFKKVSPINARARERFEKLVDELEGDKEDDKSSNGTPQVKKPKIEQTEDDANNNGDEQLETRDSVDNDAEMGDSAEVQPKVPGEVGGEAVPRAVAKKNFMEDKDGNKHPTLGKDDFTPISGDLFDPLVDYYGLCAKSFRKEQFMVRACGGAKTLFFLSNTVRTKLVDTGIQKRVTIVNSGLKAFQRNNKECEVGYRLSQEAIHFIAPHMTKRKVNASLEDFEQCLVTGTQPLEGFSEAFSSQVKPLSMGSFVVCLQGFEDNYLKKLLVVLWKCRGEAVSVMVNENEINGMKSKLRALGGGKTIAEVIPRSNGGGSDTKPA